MPRGYTTITYPDRQCTTCGDTFTPRVKHQRTCRTADCRKRYQAAWYQANAERLKEAASTRYAAQHAAINAERRDRLRADAEYRARVHAEDRARYRRDGEKIRARVQRYNRTNPEQTRLRAQRAKLTRRLAGKVPPIAQLRALLALAGGTCLRCGSSHRMSLDHIVPIAKGGTNAITNLQPLCLSCNASKKTGIADYRTQAMREEVDGWLREEEPRASVRRVVE